MRLCLLAAVLALTPAAARAADSSKLVVQTFAVADLVTPIPDFAAQAPAVKPTTADGAMKLLRTVQTIVKPHSWDCQGGPGKLEYFDAGHTLVVRQTPEVMREVADLLTALRKLQETSVVTEVRVVSVPAGFAERVGVKCCEGTVLAPREMAVLMHAVQGDRRANIMMAPKVTTFDGQTATVRVGEEQTFVTGLDAVKVKGQPVLVGKVTTAPTGDAVTLCGRVGPDGKTVTLRVNMTRTQVAGKVELLPVVTQITPVYEGGSQGVPVPFTQYVQTPEFKTFTAERTAAVPDCGTVVVGGWKEACRSEFGPPTLSKIPYLNRLFKNVGIEEREVLVLATTRVLPLDVPVAKPAVVRSQPVCLPLSPPTPFATQPPVMPAWDTVPVRMQELAFTTDATTQVKMDMMILSVPENFMGKVGLRADGGPGSRTWTMTDRERQMFVAALGNIPGVKRLSEPTAVTLDGRELSVRSGGYSQVVTGLDVSMKGGDVHVVPRTTTVDHGVTARVTPRVSADGKSFRLQLAVRHAHTTEMGRKRPVVVPIPATAAKAAEPVTVYVEEMPKQDVQSLDLTAVVPAKGTVVVGGVMVQPHGAKGDPTPKPVEYLIVLTPSVVTPTAAVVPAAASDLTKY